MRTRCVNTEGCAALMDYTPEQVAKKLCGKDARCSCRAQGASSADRVAQMRKVREALNAKPLAELTTYAQGLRDRYAKLLEELKKRPTFLSVPFNQYDGWLRELDGRLQASKDAAFASNEADAKRELVKVYFDVQTYVDVLRDELDDAIPPIEYAFGYASQVVEQAGEVLIDAGKVAKGLVEGSGTTSLGDRILPTLSPGTKVVLGLGAGAYLAAKIAPLLKK